MARRTSAQRRAKKREVRAAVAGTRAELPTLDSSVEPEKKPVKLTKPVHVSESASYTKDTKEEYDSDEGIEGSFLVSDDSEAELKFVGIPKRTDRNGPKEGVKTRTKSRTALLRGQDHRHVSSAQGRVREAAALKKYQKGVNKERYGLEGEDSDELMEQYYQWKIQGHREDDFPKFKEKNPEIAREEFLPSEPRDMSESSYEDLSTVQELQYKQRENDERVVLDEGGRLEEERKMREELAKAQALLRRKPDRGVIGSGLRESMAVRQDDKKKVRGEELRNTRRKLRESSERDRQSSEEHQRVEKVKNIIKELKDIQAGIDLKALISDSVEDAIEELIKRARLVFRDSDNIKEIDRLNGLMKNYRYGDSPKLDLTIIKYLKFKDEFLNVTKVPVSERVNELQDEYTDVSSKNELQDIRPGYQERQGRRAERKVDLKRQRARGEREDMKEGRVMPPESMMAINLAKDNKLNLAEENKVKEILEGFSSKGLTTDNLGKKDLDQVVGMAQKEVAAK